MWMGCRLVLLVIIHNSNSKCDFILRTSRWTKWNASLPRSRMKINGWRIMPPNLLVSSIPTLMKWGVVLYEINKSNVTNFQVKSPSERRNSQRRLRRETTPDWTWVKRTLPKTKLWRKPGTWGIKRCRGKIKRKSPWLEQGLKWCRWTANSWRLSNKRYNLVSNWNR